jgi:hypothetical protein
MKPATFCHKYINIISSHSTRGRGYVKTIGGHRHRSQCRRYPTSDIDICYSDIGDKYVGLRNVIPISTSEFIPISDIEVKNILPCKFVPGTPGMASELYNSMLLRLFVQIRMSDIGYRKKLYSISDIMSDSALSVRYRKFRYQAQSDIANHGYQIKCPLMVKTLHCLEAATHFQALVSS